MPSQELIHHHSQAGDRGSTRPPDRVEPPSPKGFSVDSVLRFLLTVMALGAIGWAVWYFMWLVVYLVLGGILAYLTQPIVDRLRSVGLGKLAAISVTFVMLFGSVLLLVVLLAPFVLAQVAEMTQQVSLEAVTDIVRTIEAELLLRFPFLQAGALVEAMENISETLFQGDWLSEALSSVVHVFTHIFYAALAVPFITFFFLKDGTQLRHQVLRVVPNRYFEITLAILSKVEDSIGRYFRALFIQCSAVAAVASVLLYLIGLNYALAVGIFVGLANSIPYFGPLVGFIAGSLVGIVQTGDFTMVPYVLGAMALTQASDNVLFQPLIFSKAAKAHPMVILFVVLIGAQLGGIIGMLIAIPVATTLRVLITQILWSLRNYRVLSARR